MNNFEWNTLKSSTVDCELKSDCWTCQLGDRFIDFLVLRISSISPLFYASRKLLRRAIVGFFQILKKVLLFCSGSSKERNLSNSPPRSLNFCLLSRREFSGSNIFQSYHLRVQSILATASPRTRRDD